MAAWKDMGPGTKAAVGAIIAILFGLGGYQLFGAKPGAGTGAETGTGAGTGTGTGAGTGTEAPKADATTAEAAPQPAPEAAPEPAAEASAKAPDAASDAASDLGTGRFDIVRVDPDGQTVVAGQVAPGAKVSILLDGVEIAQATADDAGKFVAMFGLSTGGAGRLMTMTATLADGAVVTVGAGVAIAQTVQAPAAGSETAASEGAAETATTSPDAAGTETGAGTAGGTTALAVTDQGAQVLQSPSEAVTGNVTIDTIAYPSPDAVQFGGKGSPGNLAQLYLDNAALGAPVRIGAEGGWNLTQAGIEPGVHTLRVDELDATGKVVSRYETPFKRETVEALAAAQASGDASAGTTAEGTGTSAPSAEAGSTPETGATESAGAQTAGTESAGTETAAADPAAATTAGATDAASTGTAAASTETPSAEQGASTEAPAAQSAEPAAEAPAITADAGAQPAGDAAPETATATEAAAAEATAPEVTGPEATGPAADPAPGAEGFVSVTVQPGFTLWGIANRELGDGTLYVQVWDANKDKIRDPDLIYPGQVFAIPKE